MGRSSATNVAIALASVLATLAAAELLLRWRAPAEWAVWPPDLQVTFTPSPELMPGIEGESRFTINERGFRADPLTADRDPVLLALGGSTTECAYLDDREAWPRLLQDRLAARHPRVWVGNAGRSGLDTRHHVVQMEKLLPQLPELDLVILLVGLNDLHHRLFRDTRYRPIPVDRLASNRFILRRAFAQRPGEARSRSFLGARVVELIAPADPDGVLQERVGAAYAVQRAGRRDALALRDALPDLSTGLEAYRRNLLQILAIARAHGVRVVFGTQPSIWRPDLSERERALLWLGGIGREERREYYSVEALAEGMARYNDVLRNVCRGQRVECVDLAATLPRDTTAYYDDVHFNEGGARAVADAFAARLLPAL